jgi:hypothetical protein
VEQYFVEKLKKGKKRKGIGENLTEVSDLERKSCSVDRQGVRHILFSPLPPQLVEVEQGRGKYAALLWAFKKKKKKE